MDHGGDLFWSWSHEDLQAWSALHRDENRKVQLEIAGTVRPGKQAEGCRLAIHSLQRSSGGGGISPGG